MITDISSIATQYLVMHSIRIYLIFDMISVTANGRTDKLWEIDDLLVLLDFNENIGLKPHALVVRSCVCYPRLKVT